MMLLPIVKSVRSRLAALVHAFVNRSMGEVWASTLAAKETERNAMMNKSGFISGFLHWLLNAVVRKLKGPGYSIDKALDVRAILGVACRRLGAVVRGIRHRVWLSRDSSWLIFLGSNVSIRNGHRVTLGKGVTVGAGSVIDGLSRNGVTIGSGASIGPHVIIEATGVISNLGVGLVFGAGSGIGAFSFIGAAGGVEIGDNVIMGQRVSFHSENHNFSDPNVDIKFQGVSRQGIKIARNCWVGANVVFLDGVQVGEGCVIAAGAVLRGVYPPNSILAGVPAKVVRSRLERR